MTKAYLLSEKDRELFLEVKRLHLQRLSNLAGRAAQPDGDQLFTPEVYYAKVPRQGIAPLTSSSTSPDSVDCDIYRLISSGGVSGDSQLVEVTGVSRRAYNLSPAAIQGESWATVIRDKFGDWSVIGGVSDGTGPTDSTGTGTAGCDPVHLETEQVRCEDGELNVYVRTTSLEIVDGCLISSVGDWAFDRTEGNCGIDVTQTINVTNIENFNDYISNVWYFNLYDSTSNINILGIWYTFCFCGSTTGTGTGTTGGVVITPSCPGGVQADLFVTVHNTTNCPCADGQLIPVTYSGSSNTWSGSAVIAGCSGMTLHVAIKDNGSNNWGACAHWGASCSPPGTGAVATCSPFALTATGIVVGGSPPVGCTGGTVSFTVTE